MSKELITKISSCWIYPIKSCAGTEVSELELRNVGPKGDREWMLIDSTGKFVTQRTEPRLALVRPTLTQESLTISRDGCDSISIDLSVVGPEIGASIWKDRVVTEEPSTQASQWFTEFLGQPVKLVKMGKNYSRPLQSKYNIPNGENSLSDGFPLLIANQTSLNELNKNLQTPISMNHFRANLVVETTTPFEEDHWKVISTKDVELKVTKPCTRCVMICNDPEKGERKDTTVLKTLGRIHKVDGKIIFGQNLAPLSLGTLQKNDELTITVED